MDAAYVAHDPDASDSGAASEPGDHAPSRPPRALCGGQSGPRR